MQVEIWNNDSDKFTLTICQNFCKFILIQFILQAGNIMSIGFEKAYALQTDMNLPASEILSTYVYRIGLLNGDYGYSTAVGLFNSVVNVILLVFVNWVVKKLNDGEGL